MTRVGYRLGRTETENTMHIDNGIGNESQDMYATDEHWRCGESERQQLGVFVKFTDMLDATGDERFAECPWMVQFEIVPHRPSEKGRAFDPDEMEWINEGAGDNPDLRFEMMREHLQGYGAGVLVNRQLSGIRAEGKKLPVPKGAVQDHEDVWAMFENLEDAQSYAEAVLEQRADALMGLVGFALDAPVNMMGTSGWDHLGEHLDLEGA